MADKIQEIQNWLSSLDQHNVKPGYTTTGDSKLPTNFIDQIDGLSHVANFVKQKMNYFKGMIDQSNNPSQFLVPSQGTPVSKSVDQIDDWLSDTFPQPLVNQSTVHNKVKSTRPEYLNNIMEFLKTTNALDRR